ncbi:DNA repair metallo-beta-lactamase-domain-containing protein [Gongronella butleri]|nr:DNA repair metallo-beta-lactamase-domain-containing protein [Gongronella butleri]
MMAKGGEASSGLISTYFARASKEVVEVTAVKDENEASELPLPCTPGPDSQQYESDLAQAMELSLEALQEQQCPVCDAFMRLSLQDFETHINECLDNDNLSPITSYHGEDDVATAPLSQELAATTLDTTPTAEIPPATPPSPQDTTNFKDDTSTPSPPRRKPVPEYKWLKDTSFVVDAFSYGAIEGCTGYFLTHFHSDHYGGLTKRWEHGPIYCSKVTANLVQMQLKVDPSFLHVLPMDTTTQVSDTVKVGLIDANHCPGSVLLVFDVLRASDGKWVRHLHTGDFRANPRMCLHPLLAQPSNPPIDTLYLDTTYLQAKYSFPAQEECIDAAARVVHDHIHATSSRVPSLLDQWVFKTPATLTPDQIDTRRRNLLIVVGTYTIGKERVFHHLAKQFGSKIFVTEQKRRILLCQENPDLESLITTEQEEAQVHVLPLMDLKADNMHAYLKSLSHRFTTLMAFKPTGWAFKAPTTLATEMEVGSLAYVTQAPAKRDVEIAQQYSSNTVKIYGVPYSEHSSFRELASFVASLHIKHIVNTVPSSSERLQQKMDHYLAKWQREKPTDVQIVPFVAESHW